MLGYGFFGSEKYSSFYCLAGLDLGNANGLYEFHFVRTLKAVYVLRLPFDLTLLM